jgi:hypothetical protein
VYAQIPLYIDAAEALPADRAALADVAPTPTRRPRGGGGFALDWESANRKAMAMLAAAIKNGTHSTDHTNRYMCTGCPLGSHWCDGIVFSATGGGTGVAGTKHYCRACYDTYKPGKNDTDLDALGITTQDIRGGDAAARPRLAFDEGLILWAARHYPAAALAYYDRGDWDWRARVLASIIRERAKRDANWLARLAASRFAGEFWDVAPYVGRAGGYPLDPRMSLRDWICEIRELEGVA